MARRGSRLAPALTLALVASLTAAGGVARAGTAHGTLRSFDGTTIAYTLFTPPSASAQSPVPVVFMTHGWGGTRTASTNGNCAAPDTVARFMCNGYAVLTWDQRGFGVSGGEANIDSQEYEVRDVQALIDLAASQPEILLDAPGDPRMGMYGGSYAGGIQLMTAAADPRIDAIVPQIAWNDLPRSLKPNGVVKMGWDLLLYGSGFATAQSGGLSGGQTGAYAPQIHQALAEGVGLNEWTQATYQWFDAKSPKHYIDGELLPDGRRIGGITAPTLVIQGSSDTLFPLQEGVKNFEQIAARGVPAAMIWYCGGHTLTPLGTSCSTGGAAQSARINAEVIAWLDAYVKGNTNAQPLTGVLYQTQDGSWSSVPALPSSEIVVAASGAFTLANTIAPTSGQVTAGTPDPTLSVRTAVPAAAGSHVVGLPAVTLQNVTATAPEAVLFLKLVDRDTATGREVVVDDQVTPVKITWPTIGAPRTVRVELNGVAWRVDQGHELSLEIATTSNDYASSRLPSIISVGGISLALPVA